MPKRKFDDAREYPSIDVIVDGNQYTVHNVMSWAPVQLVSSLNPEEVYYMIQFNCRMESVTLACADQNEQINLLHDLEA